MDSQYETSSPQSVSLFHYQNIHYLFTHQLRLRLTDREHELQAGGFGDAIPLSQVGGAKDSIEFATLAAIMIQKDGTDFDCTEYRQRLNTIFKHYAGPNLDRLDCVPTLMLSYARLLSISDLSAYSFDDCRLPRNEEAHLIEVYQKCQGSLLPIGVFDHHSSYYADLPLLRLHLTHNFNLLLKRRLHFNAVFYNAHTMLYLLLRDPQGRFSDSYDCDAYALGKSGKAPFLAQDIQSIHHIDSQNPNAIWQWLKVQCNSVPPYLENPSALTSTSVWQRSAQFYQDNSSYSTETLATVGLFTRLKPSQNMQSSACEISDLSLLP